MLTTYPGTAIDWNFYTEPQEYLGGRKLAYHRKFEGPSQ